MDRSIRQGEIDEKALLRKLILEKRRALSDKGRREKSLAIQQRFFLLDEFRQGRVIHLFLSFRGEVMTDGIVKEALALGKQVVVPVVVGGSEGMNLSEIRQYPEEVEPGAYGIPEPKKKFIRRVDPATVDLFVLPGVAFDRRGGRLGYGAGYYDRILGGTVPSRESKRVSLIALAFELQLVDRIPSSVHDVRVHKIITEERVIECVKSGMY
ncbi:MAG TPA: 5-formyltetrahydrofolate cyclo-ligase [Nitrospiria bacterium]|nr:5-formyltetrahydrofolate cyclo-ligase [Nitrospiria bacterium]